MPSSNKSFEYLLERESVRRWLSESREGKYTAQWLKEESGPSVVSRVLDDDNWVNWADLIEEHREDLVLAANCQEARAAVELARKSNSLNAAPVSQGSRLLRFFSPPLWYVLRRQVDLGDPDYWSDPKNMFREALEHPEWARMPAEFLRGELNRYLGKPDGTQNLPLPNSSPSS